MNEGVVVITSDAMRGNAYRADAHLDGTSMGPSCWWSYGWRHYRMVEIAADQTSRGLPEVLGILIGIERRLGCQGGAPHSLRAARLPLCTGRRPSSCGDPTCPCLIASRGLGNFARRSPLTCHLWEGKAPAICCCVVACTLTAWKLRQQLDSPCASIGSFSAELGDMRKLCDVTGASQLLHQLAVRPGRRWHVPVGFLFAGHPLPRRSGPGPCQRPVQQGPRFGAVATGPRRRSVHTQVTKRFPFRGSADGRMMATTVAVGDKPTQAQSPET